MSSEITHQSFRETFIKGALDGVAGEGIPLTRRIRRMTITRAGREADRQWKAANK